jgi:putative mycofactocin binding protein MftB
VQLDQAYALDPQVAVRPEPFGALCYHYGNRRLTFLRSKEMLAVVEALDHQPSVAGALRHAGVEEARWSTFVKALDSLAGSGMIRER